MRYILLSILTLGLISTTMANEMQLNSKKSPYTVAVTMDNLQKVLKEKGAMMVARVNHAAAAKNVGLEMPDTELMIFGNPKLGTLLMLNSPSTAIDLPLKILAWKDKNGQVWIGYRDPAELIKLNGLTGQEETIAKMKGALETFTNAAIATK